MGPSDNAGKWVNPPTIKITAINKPINSQLSVWNVPAEEGVIFFIPILPAIAMTGIIIPNRPIIIPIPIVKL